MEEVKAYKCDFCGEIMSKKKKMIKHEESKCKYKPVCRNCDYSDEEMSFCSKSLHVETGLDYGSPEYCSSFDRRF